MRFTWKGQTTISAYPSNTAPVLSVDGPYPKTSKPDIPTTVTKLMIRPIPRPFGTGSAYYDPLNKTVLFETITCTSKGSTSVPLCTKRLSRPLKIWRKRLQPGQGQGSSNVTINQLEGTSVFVTKNTDHCIHSDITPVDTCCQKIKIRRTGGYKPGYCTTTREYLQRRTKTYDQNQLQGKKILGKEYAYTSGEGSEPVPIRNEDTSIPKVTGICNQITIKYSNTPFQVQGGVEASSRTNRLKYDTIMSNVALKNYATARATLDTGYVNIKGQNRSKSEHMYSRQDRHHIQCKDCP